MTRQPEAFPFLEFSDDSKMEAASRFVGWLEEAVVAEARGDHHPTSDVSPIGRYWLGRLGPKDDVTRTDGRGDRLEPCAIGLRMRPREDGPWRFAVRVRCVAWRRSRNKEGDRPWRWTKLPLVVFEKAVEINSALGETTFGAQELTALFHSAGAEGLAADVRVRVMGRDGRTRSLEITFVNTSPVIDGLADGRLFQCELSVVNLSRVPFELESLPDSFRYDRAVQAFGINCGIAVEGSTIRTADAPAYSRLRPRYWAVDDPEPDLRFEVLADDPLPNCRALAQAFEEWAGRVWSATNLERRRADENWSQQMADEARKASLQFTEELERVKQGVTLLEQNHEIRTAFCGMNNAMKISSRGRYDRWRPFQLAFLLANLRCLHAPADESATVDVVWFATGGGKTETYLGLLVTAVLLDRMRGKSSGVTAWSRFPLRMLSLQQTQRFANALAAAEIVRRELALGGDEFSLGFLVGGTGTPNRVRKDAVRETDWDADRLDDMENPFRLLDACPFCRATTVTTRFDRRTWRLLHECGNESCFFRGRPLPIYVVDDEIWRFLPTIVVGTLDKAANIGFQPGMRGLVGAPWAICSKNGHGYTYATRSDRPNGCLVPDCQGTPMALPMAEQLYAPSFRLQDELHLLRDSLGAVDAHYEAALDSIQEELAGNKPKILASSATLAGYEKQISVLFRRNARVFPQPPPREGDGFWTSNSDELMRRYVAVAPRGLTIEFAVDRLVVTLQTAIRRLITEPRILCGELRLSPDFAEFLVSTYGTDVVYGNTLRDLDAVVRSSETQYGGISGVLNVANLTGRTDFEEVRETLSRLESPEADFFERVHLIAASSMMSHGVDIDRLNVMVMLGLPLGIAEFIQATARVGRRWPALVIVVPKIARERDASVYRSFPEFIAHGDRFVEPIPITRKSRRVLERTIAGMELARILLVHERGATAPLTTARNLNAWLRNHAGALELDRDAIGISLGLTPADEFLHEELSSWFEGFSRNLREPAPDSFLVSDQSPTGQPMMSLRDVEEQVPVAGDSSQ